jgi:hypothetical protein
MVQESLDLPHTPMDDVALVEVVNCFKDLSDGLRCIFLCEFSLVTDAIEEFSTCRQLCNNVVLVLDRVSTVKRY